MRINSPSLLRNFLFGIIFLLSGTQTFAVSNLIVVETLEVRKLLRLEPVVVLPPTPLVNSEAEMFNMNNKLFVQYNSDGETAYFSLNLRGTDGTIVYSKTPPANSTPTNTPTNTPTRTPSPTRTRTPTRTPSNTPTNTPTTTNTATNTPTRTPTLSPTSLPTNTDTPTSTPSDTPTNTPTPTTAPTNTPAPMASPIVISQIYGAGGESGASWRNDYVELFNKSGSSVNITNWTIQYAAIGSSTWQATVLSGTIPAGGYYLIQLGNAGANGSVLPSSEVASSLAMNNTAGKVAVKTDRTRLSGVCPTGLEDFVGYGTSNTCFDGAGPVGDLSLTTAAVRNDSGCAETNSNSVDFTVQSATSPGPRNSSTTVNVCP